MADSEPITFNVSGKIPAPVFVDTGAKSTKSTESAEVKDSSCPPRINALDINDLERFHSQLVNDSPPPPPPYAGVDPGDQSQRRKIIQKIAMYRSNYAKILKDFDLTKLDKRSVSELESLLEDVQYMVSTRKTLDSSRMMLLGGLYITESVAPIAKIRLQGLTAKCMNSPEVMEAWDECSIKYMDSIAADPLNRLMLSILMLSVSTHRENTALLTSKHVGEPTRPDSSTQPPAQPDQTTTKRVSAAAADMAQAINDLDTAVESAAEVEQFPYVAEPCTDEPEISA
jgi:hypothetical protein